MVIYFLSRLCSSRCKRSGADFIDFTVDQVHILPGFPKQISDDPLLASLAFYLQFRPGTSHDNVVSKYILVLIVKGSLADISNSINANISSVQTLFGDTSTSSVAPTLPTDKDDSDTKIHIIAGSVAGGLFIIIVAAVITLRCSKLRKR